MRSIMAEFYSALPAIRALCERALIENLEDEGVVGYLLSGVAAADGLTGIASLLNHSLTYGDEGGFTCSSCGWGYEFIRFGERIAVYADIPRGAPHEDKGLRDFKDGAPSRADGFMTPITEDGVPDARVAALLVLAKRAPSPEPALLLRHFAGSFFCCKCGVQGPMRSLWRAARAPRRDADGSSAAKSHRPARIEDGARAGEPRHVAHQDLRQGTVAFRRKRNARLRVSPALRRGSLGKDGVIGRRLVDS